MEWRVSIEYVEAGDGGNYPDYVVEKKPDPLAAWVEVTRFMSEDKAYKYVSERV